MFDYLVIGKGLIGAAAARYLSQVSPNTAVIGPDEPADWRHHQGVFASHYDQGRITRQLDWDPLWSRLAQAAIAQYPTIAAQSGVAFHTPVGGLYVAPAERVAHYLSTLLGTSLAGAAPPPPAVEYAIWTAAELAARLPFLAFPDGYQLLWEGPPAGYINPRALIQAQLALAAGQGAAISRETAVSVQPEKTAVRVATQEGQVYQARRVLLATGAFTNCFDLLAGKLALRVKSETIILARLPAAERERLRGMPTLIYDIASPHLSGIYLLPPIRYPDGHYYLKMGANTMADRSLSSLEEMQAWMAAGDSEVMRPVLQAALQAILPGLQATGWQTQRCLVTYTDHGRPYIGAIEPGRLYVATGGNGMAAKSSDTIGKLAAELTAHGRWPADWDEAVFQVKAA
jgi:glycine/D-amino acid oxidase-like deaminating enzyme